MVHTARTSTYKWMIRWVPHRFRTPQDGNFELFWGDKHRLQGLFSYQGWSFRLKTRVNEEMKTIRICN